MQIQRMEDVGLDTAWLKKRHVLAMIPGMEITLCNYMIVWWRGEDEGKSLF